ncbi:hypothetical protein MACJ_004009 [Theileria orientalis]|uniref:Uncharacterized protein n=1 Tax=Theileria orientalis TaxID=68886 RepID=A0A976SL12_THEOR|nr:hypothetical protein MACJ_004009 [Theileria orientalis]
MEPFVESSNNHKIETSWDGYTLKSHIYNINSKFKTVNEDLDVLEIKSDNKSIYSSTIYSRNSLGVFVFLYYFDGDWKIKTLNNVSYKHDDKVYHISVSPYLSHESIFLRTNNENNEKRVLFNSELDLDNESDSFVGIDISFSNKMGIRVPDYIKLDKTYKFVKLKKIKFDNHYSEFISVGLQENFIKIQEQHFGNERMNCHISINDFYLNDFINYRSQQFNSKEILERILSYNGVNNDNNDIMSLSCFIELYRREPTEKHNVWNPVINKLDHEYETEFINPFAHVTKLCSCSLLKESIFNKYSMMFTTILDFIEHYVNDDENSSKNYRNNKRTRNGNINNNKHLNNKSNLSMPLEADNDIATQPVSEHGLQHSLINMLKRNESFIVDRNVSITFGDMLLLHSNFHHNNDNVYYADQIDQHLGVANDNNASHCLHIDNCTINDALCVDVTKGTDDFQSLPVVDQVLSSWVIEHKEISKLDTDHHCSRVFIPGDTIEHLREHKRKQKKLISQILTSMDGKS